MKLREVSIVFDGATILITGGTGSFGKACTEYLLKHFKPLKIIIFSRDEFKQYEMAKTFSPEKYPPMRYFIGDVRDRDRLYRAFNGVDYVIHAAALKHVPAAEYNPFEAVKTNIYGASNIVDAAIDLKVKKVIALSTDKAVSPVNLYGATKLCSDKLFSAANSYSPDTQFSIVRYGNVLGSRGSVIPFFLQQRETGVLPVTDPRMTRFWITLESGIRFVLDGFQHMRGGEIFVPKLPTMNIIDLAHAICPHCEIKIVGIRPGEKIHEVMIPADESRNTRELKNHYIILSPFSSWLQSGQALPGTEVEDGFEYSSGTNPWLLSVEELQTLVNVD